MKKSLKRLLLATPGFEGVCRLLPFFWVPENARNDRAEQDRRIVMNFADQLWNGEPLIRKTSGDVTDYRAVCEDIAALADEFNIISLSYDPWGPAQALIQNLQELGFPHDRLVDFRQNMSNFAAPTKEFEK